MARKRNFRGTSAPALVVRDLTSAHWRLFAPLLRNAIITYIKLSLASPVRHSILLHPISLTIARLLHSCLPSIQRNSIVFGRLIKIQGRERSQPYSLSSNLVRYNPLLVVLMIFCPWCMFLTLIGDRGNLLLSIHSRLVTAVTPSGTNARQHQSGGSILTVSIRTRSIGADSAIGFAVLKH